MFNPKQIKKLDTAYTDGKTKCVCGHTEAMLPSTDSRVCTHCGRTILNRSKARFRYMFYKAKEKQNERI